MEILLRAGQQSDIKRKESFLSVQVFFSWKKNHKKYTWLWKMHVFVPSIYADLIE